MKIDFVPIRMDHRFTASVAGDVLTLDGEDFDFGPLPEGATLPASAVASDWIVGEVSRVDGAICLTLLLPHGANPPSTTCFPQPVEVAAGQVPLPPYELAADAEPEQEDVSA